ncbi:MAG TPA: hypothetical protein VG738_10115 [Chitinophagaceae bacterium]|nr:hypothetical protein [Chitinophagaceae bacterium]
MRFRNFVRKLLVPKTGIYILLGTVIMFLTFFTDDNALEIAISGIASIFIGIGVNNFTESETHVKDAAANLKKIESAIKILAFTKNKVNNTEMLFKENLDKTVAQQQLAELGDFLSLSIEQLELHK